MKTFIRLDCFNKKDDKLVEEYEIPISYRNKLINLFNTSDLIGGSLVTNKEKSYLEKVINKKMNLKKYDYVLEEVEDRVINIDDCEWKVGRKKQKPKSEL